MKKYKQILTIVMLIILVLCLSLFILSNKKENQNLHKEYAGQNLDITFRFSDDWSVRETQNCNNPLSAEQNCVDIQNGNHTIRIYSEVCDANCDEYISMGSMTKSELGEYNTITIDKYIFLRFGIITNNIPRSDGRVVLGVPVVSEMDDDYIAYSPQLLINGKLYVIMYLVPPQTIEREISNDEKIAEMDSILETLKFEK